MILPSKIQKPQLEHRLAEVFWITIKFICVLPVGLGLGQSLQ